MNALLTDIFVDWRRNYLNRPSVRGYRMGTFGQLVNCVKEQAIARSRYFFGLELSVDLIEQRIEQLLDELRKPFFRQYNVAAYGLQFFAMQFMLHQLIVLWIIKNNLLTNASCAALFCCCIASIAIAECTFKIDYQCLHRAQGLVEREEPYRSFIDSLYINVVRENEILMPPVVIENAKNLGIPYWFIRYPQIRKPLLSWCSVNASGDATATGLPSFIEKVKEVNVVPKFPHPKMISCMVRFCAIFPLFSHDAS